MKKKIVRRVVAQDSLSALSELSPLLQRIFAARKINTAQELERELTSLHSFQSLLNIDKAALRLAHALDQQQRILVIGDFDADGATSTALAVSALKKMGATQVDFLVPNRFKFGYGLTPEIVDVAALEKKPHLIVTVDNGIASHAGVTRAKQLGMDVIITDHHLQGATLPEADAIVNPNQYGDLFPSKCAAGVGVIFYVMLALRNYLKESAWFEKTGIEYPNMSEFLDLVALGTVADVVALDKNNRIFVYHGVRRIQSRIARPGILALLKVAGRECEKITSVDLGFVVGPRLNAAGRLDDMSLGINCLLADNLDEAESMAKQLDALNRERRAIEVQMQKEAFDIVDRLQLQNRLPAGLCLYDPHWHQGIIGLVASRVKEKIHRPVIAFSKVDDFNLKGSARSIEGVHIRDVLDAIATQHPQLLAKFGGHAMAAGLSIALSDYEQFNSLFSAEILRRISEEELQGKIETDGELSHDDFSLDTVTALKGAGPWGQGFPEPLFDGIFHIVDQRVVGQRHLKLTLKIPKKNAYLEGIAFNVDLNTWPNPRCQQAHMIYRLDINEYQGRQKLQLVVDELIPC